MRRKKQSRSKIYELRAYVGYGEAGRKKLAKIMDAAKGLHLNVSEMVLDALRSKYPSLGL